MLNHGDMLDERRDALETAFFRQQDAKLRERLRKKAEDASMRAALSAASGVKDDAVLDELIAMNIGAESLAALALIPLVAVAWADGKMEDAERNAILKSASEFGIDGDHESYELLDGWLATEPGPELLAAWKDYIASISTSMNPDARNAFQRDLLGRARSVAEAAGGFLGLGNKVSDVESKVLNELESAFA
ncbi:MAG: hypothetical protein AAF432_08460 [Planctomycetota bacterium]